MTMRLQRAASLLGLGFAGFVVLAVQAGCGASAEGRTDQEALRTLALFEQELEVIDLLLSASEAYPARDHVIRHVNIVAPATGEVRADMLVRVADGRIVAVGPDRGDPAGADATEIDGTGRYLLPGLADMHVHQLTSASQHLLHVATGVTTVRDMVGFPWLLEWREKSERDEWLAPSMIVAGPIISSRPMGMYAQVVEDEAAARELVREHADAGYDYIKVHNALEPAVYRAVLDEAARIGIGVVGHVPHDLTVADAVGGGQETIEHFKGYINDRTLEISDSDWIPPTARGSVWLTPTLYSTRTFMRGDSALAWLVGPEARYVPALVREGWREEASGPVPTIVKGLPEKNREILRRLLPVTDRFLAGTDAGGGYPFMVSGFGLHEELRLLADAGMSPLHVLRAATTYAAEATDRTGEFGRVAPGLRADLLLLGSDPLISLDALDDREGVMVRGRWLDREALDGLLDRLAAIYDRVPDVARSESEPSAAWLEAIEEEVRRLRAAGYVFPDHQLTEFREALVVAAGVGDLLVAHRTRDARKSFHADSPAHAASVVAIGHATPAPAPPATAPAPPGRPARHAESATARIRRARRRARVDGRRPVP